MTVARVHATMPKALTIIGMVVSILILLIFALDMALAVPFRGASTVMDISFILAAAMLGYLSWSAYRELK